LRKKLGEETEDVAAHDFCDGVFGETFLEQSASDQDEAGGVEGSGDGAIEIGAEGDVVHADDPDGIADGARDGVDVCAAHSGLPVTDADDAAGLGDAAELVVGEVARVVAGSLDAAVGKDDRTSGDGEHVANGLRRGMGQIDNHAAGLHEANEFAAFFSEAALGDAVSGAGERIVEKVGQADQSVAGVIDAVEIG